MYLKPQSSNCFKRCGFVITQEGPSEDTFNLDVNLKADWNTDFKVYTFN